MPVPSPPTIVQDSTATPCALPQGDWVAAAFAERQAWRRVAGELKACGPGHAWNLRDLARLDQVGAHILGAEAGELMPLLNYAVTRQLKVEEFRDLITIHPTLGENVWEALAQIGGFSIHG